MRGCSGADEYEAGKEKKSQYTHYKKLDYTTAPNPLSIKTMRTDEKEFRLLARKSVQTSIKLTSFQKRTLLPEQEMKCFQRHL